MDCMLLLTVSIHQDFVYIYEKIKQRADIEPVCRWRESKSPPCFTTCRTGASPSAYPASFAAASSSLDCGAVWSAALLLLEREGQRRRRRPGRREAAHSHSPLFAPGLSTSLAGRRRSHHSYAAWLEERSEFAVSAFDTLFVAPLPMSRVNAQTWGGSIDPPSMTGASIETPTILPTANPMGEKQCPKRDDGLYHQRPPRALTNARLPSSGCGQSPQSRQQSPTRNLDSAMMPRPNPNCRPDNNHTKLDGNGGLTDTLLPPPPQMT
jgi:hypothetical protein